MIDEVSDLYAWMAAHFVAVEPTRRPNTNSSRR
jgi:hypothetical protein